MAHDLILHEAIIALRDSLGAELDAIRVSRAVVGLYFTGVSLDCGTAGACHTPAKTAVHEACCPMGEQVMPFPGTLRGRPATDLLDYALSPNLLARAVGIATLNALAELLWQRRPHPGVELRVNVDGYDAAAIQPEEQVVLVGAFIPFLRALKQKRQPYTVLELSTAMLKPEELPHYRPATDAADVIPGGDVVLLTGSTLLTNTLDDLLRMCRPEARVVVVGPTVGLLPEPLLRRGVDVIGGIRVTAPETFLDVLAEGGSGAHFFGRSADRVVLARRGPKPALA
jgi:uncharacterized protein (DUF4213/DUF364 family)